MRIELTDRQCVVTRESGDPKFYNSGSGAGESRLLYHVKRHLNAQGHDLIKKRMHKDGHLVDEQQQYLRSRSAKSPKPHIMVWFDQAALRGANEDFNAGQVTLRVEPDCFCLDTQEAP